MCTLEFNGQLSWLLKHSSQGKLAYSTTCAVHSGRWLQNLSCGCPITGRLQLLASYQTPLPGTNVEMAVPHPCSLWALGSLENQQKAAPSWLPEFHRAGKIPSGIWADHVGFCSCFLCTCRSGHTCTHHKHKHQAGGKLGEPYRHQTIAQRTFFKNWAFPPVWCGSVG